jgi:hypothetical protein
MPSPAEQLRHPRLQTTRPIVKKVSTNRLIERHFRLLPLSQITLYHSSYQAVCSLHKAI